MTGKVSFFHQACLFRAPLLLDFRKLFTRHAYSGRHAYYVHESNVPCGHFVLWFNVPRGSYCWQGLMTGNYSDIICLACLLFGTSTYCISSTLEDTCSFQSHCCLWHIFCNFCIFFGPKTISQPKFCMVWNKPKDLVWYPVKK